MALTIEFNHNYVVFGCENSSSGFHSVEFSTIVSSEVFKAIQVVANLKLKKHALFLMPLASAFQ